MLRNIFRCCVGMWCGVTDDPIIEPDINDTPIGPGLMATAIKFSFEGKRVCYIDPEDIYDGDTFWATTVIPGWNHPVKLRCRVENVDTSEVRGGTPHGKALGVAAKLFLRDIIGGKTLNITMGKFDLYGRILVNVDINQGLLSDILINSGHAIPYSGSGEKKSEKDKKYASLTTEATIAAYVEDSKSLTVLEKSRR